MVLAYKKVMYQHLFGQMVEKREEVSQNTW
jgi:hypothetical protein